MSDVCDIAARVSAAWGPLRKPPRLIVERENAVFELHFTDGRRGALRLHRQGYQTSENILSELRWTERLAEAGFPCPVPLRSLQGDLIVALDNAPVASVIQWIDASPVSELGLSGQDLITHYHTIGALIGQLHTHTDALDLSGITRLHWDREGFVGDTPLWGRFWQNPALSPSERATVLEARSAADDALRMMPSPDIGLIHADLLQENILIRDGTPWLIDFDDAGFGYRLYDLGTALIQHIGNPNYGEICSALSGGYAETRDVFVDPGTLDLFVLLRGFASCGWIISRAPPEDPIQRVYAERAVKLASEFCARR